LLSNTPKSALTSEYQSKTKEQSLPLNALSNKTTESIAECRVYDASEQ